MRGARRRPRLRPSELRQRLARLRAKAAWLGLHASLGRALRRSLVEAGAATWKPSEDLSWRRWIERCGDDQARELLVAVDEMLEKRAAGLEAAGGAVEGSEEVRRVRVGDQTVPKRAI